MMLQPLRNFHQQIRYSCRPGRYSLNRLRLGCHLRMCLPLNRSDIPSDRRPNRPPRHRRLQSLGSSHQQIRYSCHPGRYSLNRLRTGCHLYRCLSLNRSDIPSDRRPNRPPRHRRLQSLGSSHQQIRYSCHPGRYSLNRLRTGCHLHRCLPEFHRSR